MPIVKMNSDLWKSISEEEKEGIRSGLNVLFDEHDENRNKEFNYQDIHEKYVIIQDDDAIVPDHTTPLYGMDIEEIYSLLSMHDKSALIMQMEHDVKAIKYIDECLGRYQRYALMACLSVVSEKNSENKRKIAMIIDQNSTKNSNSDYELDQLSMELMEKISSRRKDGMDKKLSSHFHVVTVGEIAVISLTRRNTYKTMSYYSSDDCARNCSLRYTGLKCLLCEWGCLF